MSASHNTLQVLVPDTEHWLTLCCRYISPQKPPTGVVSPSDCHRYVSLVPFMHDSLIFADRHDVWSTTAEMIEIGAGDYEEHAIMLANFFLHIGTFVCLNLLCS